MSGVIHISEMTSLALHGMAYIAGNGHKMLNVKEVAGEIGASEAHLSKVLQRLVKVGLLHSTRGPNGGFVLAKAPDQISLLDIYQVIEGPLFQGGCPTQRANCPFNRCLFGGILQKLNREFEVYLKNQTLKDFNNSLK